MKISVLALCLAVANGFLHQNFPGKPRMLMTGGSGNECEESALEKELNGLHGIWQYTQALRQRNRAQLDSFVDADAQWAAMSKEDKQYLVSEKHVETRMAQIRQELKVLRDGDEGKGAER